MRKLAIGVIAAMAVSATVGGLLIHSANTSADFDLPGLNQQVQNHEARIANTENDVKVLQDSTKTAPAPNPVVVPAVTAQPVDPAPALSPAPPAPETPYILGYWCAQAGLVDAHWSDGKIDKGIQNPHPGICIAN